MSDESAGGAGHDVGLARSQPLRQGLLSLLAYACNAFASVGSEIRISKLVARLPLRGNYVQVFVCALMS